MTKAFGPRMGIRVCGEMDERGFHRLCYFPFLEGTGISTQAPVSVERRADGCTFAGMAEDGRVGISLIYFLQNPVDYRKQSFREQIRDHKVSTTLTGLAQSGMILLPQKGNDPGSGDDREAFYKKHDSLVFAAKNGNEEAIESLTMEDMDTYAMISRRIGSEDVLSIVDSYVMPYGMECDQYQILGTILFYTKVQNILTKESVWQLSLNCNGMEIEVAVNSADLLGEPETGRRFKGNVWLQGKLHFEE